MQVRNTIINGDATEVMRNKIEDESIDLVVTSPPYDNLRSYNKKIQKKTKKKYNNYSFDFENIARELYRVMKKGGVVVWVVGDATIDKSETGSSFRQALFFMSLGFKLHDTMIYEKNGPSFPARRDSKRYSQVFEYMFVLSKDGPPKTANLLCDKKNNWAGYKNFGKASYRNKDGELIQREQKVIPKYSPRFNIWKYNTGKNYSTTDKEAFKHPAIFPEELAEDHILTWSNKGDIVLDPFAGSGTTLKMASLNDRKYIGIEIVEEYYKLAIKRLENFFALKGFGINPKEAYKLLYEDELTISQIYRYGRVLYPEFDYDLAIKMLLDEEATLFYLVDVDAGRVWREQIIKTNYINKFRILSNLFNTIDLV